MTDLSFAEVMVVVGVGVVLIGKRELPLYARQAGGAVGRLVGTLVRTRASLDGFAKHNELAQLHAEFSAGVSELSQIRSELLNATVIQRGPAAGVAASSSSTGGGGGVGGDHARSAKPPQATASSARAGGSAATAAGASTAGRVPAVPASVASAGGRVPPIATPIDGATTGTNAVVSAAAGAKLSAASVAGRQPSRVALAVATEQFAAQGGAQEAGGPSASGADLLAEGIIDAIWLDEHIAQAAKGT